MHRKAIKASPGKGWAFSSWESGTGAVPFPPQDFVVCVYLSIAATTQDPTDGRDSHHPCIYQVRYACKEQDFLKNDLKEDPELPRPQVNRKGAPLLPTVGLVPEFSFLQYSWLPQFCRGNWNHVQAPKVWLTDGVQEQISWLSRQYLKIADI